MKKCIIVANGKAPSIQRINYLKSVGFDYLIAADGGANSLFKLKIIPDLIIGDLDSIHNNVLEYYKTEKRVEVIKFERQDDTDIEKSLKFVIEKGCSEVVLLGAIGDRIDHSFCNIGIILKFNDRINIKIISGKSVMYCVTGNEEIKSVVGETISIYGILPDTKFTSEGLIYPLENQALPFGVCESTSNVSVSTSIKLEVKNGKGLIVRDFNLMKKNGLI